MVYYKDDSKLRQYEAKMNRVVSSYDNKMSHIILTYMVIIPFGLLLSTVAILAEYPAISLAVIVITVLICYLVFKLINTVDDTELVSDKLNHIIPDSIEVNEDYIIIRAPIKIADFKFILNPSKTYHAIKEIRVYYKNILGITSICNDVIFIIFGDSVISYVDKRNGENLGFDDFYENTEKIIVANVFPNYDFIIQTIKSKLSNEE